MRPALLAGEAPGRGFRRGSVMFGQPAPGGAGG